jgi:hypothetical protein
MCVAALGAMPTLVVGMFAADALHGHDKREAWHPPHSSKMRSNALAAVDQHFQQPQRSLGSADLRPDERLGTLT